ncbi:C-GCAxxG-C-C family protein [Faecalicatena sp. AGMB00832]|uniref:C-GCAxxG-C-C family protein n=1 Tax=Faecalicatena faecalis TaxID=2726362 RepID=A0ABS6D5A7_9FIRM|nr:MULTISPECIES: C-GCAxxG-C-C family protein [Faecalicatena]MBU3876356.1 C-GCAxxG-C-C family protein [Faecalicatena faecalis]MCI6464350.1 C-GCAxxG-C-C family protein [Faecalicatena sp.]MDY5621325.1 C-GCAxxG-C-C family protein [Lachnospiraceae bacterium]
MTKKELALEYHKKGYNCAQAVACVFCEDFGIAEKEMFRIAEGFGFGMGMMEVCGALSGLFMIIGLQNSVGDLEKGKSTKADTYKKVKECAAKFKEKNRSILCRELKGIGSDRPICSCDQCIADAVELAEEYLQENPVRK